MNNYGQYEQLRTIIISICTTVCHCNNFVSKTLHIHFTIKRMFTIPIIIMYVFSRLSRFSAFIAQASVTHFKTLWTQALWISLFLSLSLSSPGCVLSTRNGARTLRLGDHNWSFKQPFFISQNFRSLSLKTSTLPANTTSSSSVIPTVDNPLWEEDMMHNELSRSSAHTHIIPALAPQYHHWNQIDDTQMKKNVGTHFTLTPGSIPTFLNTTFWAELILKLRSTLFLNLPEMALLFLGNHLWHTTHIINLQPSPCLRHYKDSSLNPNSHACSSLTWHSTTFFLSAFTVRSSIPCLTSISTTFHQQILCFCNQTRSSAYCDYKGNSCIISLD